MSGIFPLWWHHFFKFQSSEKDPQGALFAGTLYAGCCWLLGLQDRLRLVFEDPAGIGLPALIAIVWGMFISPKATYPLNGASYLTVELLLLALRPRNSAGIWELAFFHKTAMAISALVLSGAKDAGMMAGAVDGALAIPLLIAYICTCGCVAWKRFY